MQRQAEAAVSHIDESRSRAAESGVTGQLPASRDLDGDLGGASKLWATLERLAKESPREPQAAIDGASILIKLSSSAAAREELIKALRTEVPAHFAFEEVRVEAFRALAKYSDEPRLAVLALEELETFPHRAKSCAEAVSILNSIPQIEESAIIDRITELFIRERSTPVYKEILLSLRPKFAAYASESLAKQLVGLSEQIYLGKEKGSEAILAALALSHRPSCIEALCKIAKQDFFEGSRLPKWANDLLVFATAVAISVGPGAALGAIIARHPLGAVLGAVVNFIGVMIWAGSSQESTATQASDYKPRTRVPNEPLALEAIAALRLSTEHWQARETLLKLSGDQTQPQSISGYAKQSLKSGRPSSNLEVLLRDIRNPSPELRELSLHGLAKQSGGKVIEAVTQATNDRDRGIRQVAYEALAQIKKNGASI